VEKKDSTIKTHFDRFVEVMSELRKMSMSEKAYDNERAKMASLIGEGVNLSYTLLTGKENKLKKQEIELNRLIEENNRLREALKQLINKEPSVDLSVFEEGE